MNGRRFWISAAVALAAVAWRGDAAAQSYGPTDQVLSIDSTAFMPPDSAADVSSDGYLYESGSGGYIIGLAPLLLPDGAEITQICLYANNSDPSDVVDMGLQAVKLVPGGQAPGVVDIPGTLLVANFHFGYGTVCTDPLSYVFHDVADVDGDGIEEVVAHRLWAYLPQGPFFGAFGLGGARITWHRRVSPGPAAATFNDVSTGDPFFQFVEALAASGITAGCGGGAFCPASPVTRGQMAVFLAKALGLHWPI